jgi:ADP-ribose pyrophosphatase YjhB (NUDIX family)
MASGFSGGFGASFSKPAALVAPVNFLPASDVRKTITLPDGFVAVPVWQIRRAAPSFNPEEVARANKLTSTWQIKGTAQEHQQRCPAIWVDNIVIQYKAGMGEPCVLLGHWAKDVIMYGDKVVLEGLAIAGGGHYERCANKPKSIMGNAGKYVTPEAGDLSLRQAADKELKEEIGVNPRNIRATHELGYMDDVFADGRYHGVRHIYLRWLEQDTVRGTSELSTIVATPLSMLPALCRGEIPWTPEGTTKELGLILGHDRLLRLVFTLPATQEFIEFVKNTADAAAMQPQLGRAFGFPTPSAPAAGGSGW